jgi:N-acetylmuramoyl-L-alanine amidase
MRTIRVAAAFIAIAAGLAAGAPAAAAQSAHTIYTRALARERHLRDAENRATLTQLRKAVQSYEAVVRRYPRSGYSDNALWQAANLAVLAFDRFSQAADQRTAVRLFTHLSREYPASSLGGRAKNALKSLENRRASAPAPVADEPSRAAAPPAAATPVGDDRAAAPAGRETGVVTIRDIKRTPLPDGVRVSIEMDGESLFRTERLDNPSRVFFDLRNARTVPALQDATLRFDEDGIVREIRLGRHPKNTTRVVMDLASVEAYNVFTLYNPYRVVVDFRRASEPVPPGPAIAPGISPPLSGAKPVEPAGPAPTTAAEVALAREPVPPVTRPSAPPLVSPAVPAANSNGQFSLARQLGLGVARIVLDAGHGGHDPGARANGVTEAELVLDVTLRLRALLEKQPGIEVTLTRETNTFIPLEERTAIANKRGADLFLSIHANASRNSRARGIETYFLNFASNPEAEAVAARENSASGRTMRSLPDIVRAIALNNKIDESRDFAEMVQRSMVRRLRARNREVRDLGVKQAPFVVLIGAGMPSVLAEISFVTNRQEGALLKTPAYRQQIAESLLDAILTYQRSLKGVRAVASKE